MFGSNYYCLVAGLREYTLEADAKGFDARAIVSEILEGVSRADARQVRLLYTYYDCEHLAALHAGRTVSEGLGNLTPDELAEELRSPRLLPDAVQQVLRAYADPEGEEAAEIDPAWFPGAESVGICGATSTPKWLMQEVADRIGQIGRR